MSFTLSCVFILLNSVLLFQLKELCLAFLVKQVKWWWTLSAFVFLWKSLSLLHLWRTTLPCIVFLVGRVFFLLSALWIYHPTLSPTTKLLLRNPTDSLMSAPFYVKLPFPCCSQDSLSLTFENLIIMCLSVTFFRLNLFKDLELCEPRCLYPSHNLVSFQPLFL